MSAAPRLDQLLWEARAIRERLARLREQLRAVCEESHAIVADAAGVRALASSASLVTRGSAVSPLIRSTASLQSSPLITTEQNAA